MLPALSLRVPFLPSPWRLGALAYGLVGALFIAGAAAGALAANGLDGARRHDLAAYVEQLVGFESSAVRPPAAELLAHSFWNEGVRTAGLLWLLGLSIIGAPFILGAVFARGYGLGFTAAFLVGEGRWEGVALTFAGVVPHAMFVVPGLILAAGSALSFSLVAAAIVFGARRGSAFAPFASSTARCVAGGLLLLLGRLVEAYITPVLLQTVGAYFHGG